MHDIAALQKRLETEKDREDILICAIEEMSETTKVITKYLRGSDKFSVEKLTEEVAHAQLMLAAVQNIFGIPDADIDHEKLLALKKCFGLD